MLFATLDPTLRSLTPAAWHQGDPVRHGRLHLRSADHAGRRLPRHAGGGPRGRRHPARSRHLAWRHRGAGRRRAGHPPRSRRRSRRRPRHHRGLEQGRSARRARPARRWSTTLAAMARARTRPAGPSSSRPDRGGHARSARSRRGARRRGPHDARHRPARRATAPVLPGSTRRPMSLAGGRRRRDDPSERTGRARARRPSAPSLRPGRLGSRRSARSWGVRRAQAMQPYSPRRFASSQSASISASVASLIVLPLEASMDSMKAKRRSNLALARRSAASGSDLGVTGEIGCRRTEDRRSLR